jgi:5-methylcytosine-specific restriction enzyme A
MTMYSQSLDISTELWVALLQDSSVFEEKDVDLMEALFNCKNHRAIATELAEILDVPYYGVLNLQVGALGKRIVNKLPYVKYPINEDTENISYWQIPFWGEDAEKKGRYYWELRPELRKAIEELLNTKNIIAEEITEKKIDKLPEGALKYITVNAYERNQEARKKCIEEYGYTCSVCGFNFEEVYGEIGTRYIHVHHLKPFSEIKEESKVDPINDLRPLCPNCHSMIHKANITIEQLRDAIRKQEATTYLK